jgi:hypothetical protein
VSIQRHQEISNTRTIVDPRTFYQKTWALLQYPWIPFAWALFSAMVTLVWAGFLPFAVLGFLVLRWAVTSVPDVLPIHLPLEANKIDMNDPKIGDNAGFNKARGSFFIGKIRSLGLEVWASFKAMTQHFLIFGTTGAGKTESIVSYLANYLAVGSGAAFQDAKAAPKSMVQVGTICRIFGRDDDFRVTNYITGLTSEHRDPAERLSNDAAVFARGSAESNTQLLVSLMPPSEGENKIFAERAVALVSAEFPALTDLRDMGVLQIDPGVIRKHMSFKFFVQLFRDNRITKRSRDALQGYLESLPGYDENKDITEQPEEVTRQFGFAQAYFTRSLASLSDTYGHIYMVGQGEIDYQDAVLNGRILLTLLPSMEKSGEELSNLGKIVLTATKNGMVVGLGTVFEGSAEDIVHNLPTNSDIPYGVINDENAYMLVEGQEIINAQARGLGFGVITGTQDAPGMIENISRTTKQIMANSAFKQIMYIDDKETTELAREFSGEAQVLVRNQYERDGDLGNVYASSGVGLEKQYRISETDIKKQGTGQAFLLYQGSVHEVQVFNHGISEKGPDPLRRFIDHWYPVRMAKVKIPNEDTILRYMQHTPRQEWEDLLLMLKDDARHMLSEMTTYFASQSVIRGVASLYAEADAQTIELSQRTFVAKQFLEQKIDPPSGLIKTLCEQLPSNASDVVKTMVFLAHNSGTSHLKIQQEADEANLDAFSTMPPLPADLDDFFEEVDTSTSGGNSGGGGLTPMKPESALSDFLGADYASDEENDPVPASAVAAAQSPVVEMPAPVPPEPEPTSAMAKAVSRSMAMMPWMSSEIDYAQVRGSIKQAEMLFNEDDAPAAEAAADDVIDRIIQTLEYPQTKISSDLPSQVRAKQLFKDWLD